MRSSLYPVGCEKTSSYTLFSHRSHTSAWTRSTFVTPLMHHTSLLSSPSGENAQGMYGSGMEPRTPDGHRSISTQSMNAKPAWPPRVQSDAIISMSIPSPAEKLPSDSSNSPVLYHVGSKSIAPPTSVHPSDAPLPASA